MDLLQSVRSLLEESLLGRVLRRSHRPPRIRQHFDRNGFAQLTDVQTNLVAAGWNQTAGEVAESKHSRNSGGGLAPEIPGEPIQPGAGFLDLAEVLVARRLGIGGVRADHGTVFENLHGDQCIRLLRQRIKQLCTSRRVLSYGFTTTRPGASLTPHDSHRVTRRENVEIGALGFGGTVSHRCEVVQDPKAAPLRSREQVTVMHLEVSDGHYREIALPLLPVGAVVKRDVQPQLGAGVEQALQLRIFPHHTHPCFILDAVHDASPTATVILCLVDVRSKIVELVIGGNHVGLGRVVGRRIDCVDHGAVHAVGRDIAPALPAIPRHLHQTVIRPNPDRALLHR